MRALTRMVAGFSTTIVLSAAILANAPIGTTYATWQAEATVSIGTIHTSDRGLPTDPIDPGDPTPPPYPGPTECDIYDAHQGYQPGDCVTYEDSVWEADFTPSPGQEPGDPNGPWMERGEIVADVPADIAQEGTVIRRWTTTWIYGRNGNQEIVEHNGRYFILVPGFNYSRGVEPGLVNRDWMEFGDIVIAPDGNQIRTWTATWIYDVGDMVAWENNFYRVRWRSRNQQPGDLHGPWQQMEFDGSQWVTVNNIG